MNDLIRQAIAAEAEERVDSRTVLANLHKARKRKPLGLIVGVATLTAAAAAAAVVVPMTIKKTEAAPPAVSAPQETQNVLLIGLDDHNFTDALMLARFQADGTAVSVVSLPRDILVDGQKINGLFAQSPAKLTAAVEKTTGAKVDHHAAVKMSAIGRISELFGGVAVCLKAPSNDPITKAAFPAGRQVLQGDQALAFLRQRHGLENGDLDRARRQQVFLADLASKITKDNALTLAREVSGSISVDDGWDLVGFAQRFTGPIGISVTTLPVDAPVEREAGFGFEVDPAKARTFVEKALDQGGSSGGSECIR